MENKSYTIIIDYLKEENDLTKIQKRYLMKYATKIKEENIDYLHEEKREEIIEAIKEINNELRKSNNTSIATKRIQKEIDIIEKAKNYQNLDLDEKFDLTFEIEALYNDLDLPIRKNSNLSYRLLKKQKQKKK